MQVACQNLGPLEKGGVVVGIDIKVILHISAYFVNRASNIYLQQSIQLCVSVLTFCW